MKRQEKKVYYTADTENTVPRSSIYEEDMIDENRLYEDIYNNFTLPYDSPSNVDRLENESDTHVWAAAICKVKKDCKPEDVTVYSSMEDFINSCRRLEGLPVVYFHNAAWDLQFVTVTLLRMGFKESLNGREMTAEEKAIYDTLTDEGKAEMDAKIKERLNRRSPSDMEFMPLISGDGIWYSLKVRFAHNHKCVEFRDSLKLLPFSVDKIARDFKTKAQKLKGSIDYTIQRDKDWVITPTEELYIKNDVLVMSEALALIEPMGMLDSLTIGAHCMKDFKTRLGKGNYKAGKEIFESLFPAIDIVTDEMMRKSYHGGWCYNNTNGQIIDMRNSSDNIEVYDVNSLYPSVMYEHDYPIGEPIEFDGKDFSKYANRQYIVHFTCEFIIKPKHLPFIQFKNSRWKDNEYIKDSEGLVNMYMTRPDFELFLEQYNVYELTILDGWWFKSSKTLFNDYIEAWYEIKKNSSGNKVMRTIAKLHLNNLYGKFAAAILRKSAHPYIDDDGMLRFNIEEETTRGGYIPIGAFCTAYARGVTIRAAQANFDIFNYSDTDSIHLSGKAKGIKVGFELGEWENETSADMARFVRQKTYIEHTTHEDGEPIAKPYWNIKACGCPEEAKKRLLYRVTEYVYDEHHEVKPVFHHLEYDENENIISPRRTDDEFMARFTYGLVEAGKMMKRRVVGGVILEEKTFSINL